MKRSMTIEDFKEDIKNYIDSYLENDDEFTERHEQRLKDIQEDDEVLTRLATELYNNGVLNTIDDIGRFNYERNYYINELLKGEL